MNVTFVRELFRRHRFGLSGRLADEAAPAIRFSQIALRCDGCTVSVLNLRRQQRHIHRDVARITDGQLACLSLLGRNHDDTVGGSRTVQSGSVGAFQHIDALDVVGVNHRQRVCSLRRSRFGEGLRVGNLTASLVGHRHTIHNDERRRRAKNGLCSAQLDFRGTASTTSTWRNGDARHLALQGIGDVHLLHLHELVRLDLLRRIGQRLLLSEDTHSRDDHFLNVLRDGLQLDSEGGTAVSGNLLRFVADV